MQKESALEYGMIKRKLEEFLSAFFRAVVFPLKKINTEIKTKSIICPGAYFNRGTILNGKNHLDRNVYLSNVSLGFGSYVGRNSYLVNLKVGKFSSIGQGVTCAFGKHPLDRVSTHPAFYSSNSPFPAKYVNKTTFEENTFLDKENGYAAYIGNDVWIGNGVIISEGVKIGDGAVVGAGSLVLKDVPPYSVYGGVPAKLLKMRFDENTVNKISALKWWDKDEKWLIENAHLFDDTENFFNTKGRTQ